MTKVAQFHIVTMKYQDINTGEPNCPDTQLSHPTTWKGLDQFFYATLCKNRGSGADMVPNSCSEVWTSLIPNQEVAQFSVGGI